MSREGVPVSLKLDNGTCGAWGRAKIDNGTCGGRGRLKFLIHFPAFFNSFSIFLLSFFLVPYFPVPVPVGVSCFMFYTWRIRENRSGVKVFL